MLPSLASTDYDGGVASRSGIMTRLGVQTALPPVARRAPLLCGAAGPQEGGLRPPALTGALNPGGAGAIEGPGAAADTGVTR